MNKQTIKVLSRKKLYKYFANSLIRNKIIWFLTFLTILLIVGFTAFTFNKAENVEVSFYENSLILVALPTILSVLTIVYSNILLFSSSKKNGVDLFLYTKSYENKSIVVAKQLSILLVSMNVIIGLLISSSLMVFMGLPLLKALFYIFISFVSILVANSCWIILFSFISITTSFLLGIVSTMAVTFTFAIGGILPIVGHAEISKPKVFDFATYKQNAGRIYKLDQNGNIVDSSFVLVENPSAKLDNKIETPKITSQLNPFNFILGFSSYFINDISSSKLTPMQIYSAHEKYSASYQKVKKESFYDVVNYDIPVISMASDKVIFEYISKNNLYSEIEKELLSSQAISDKVKDSNFWDILRNELKVRNIWKGNLSASQEKIIKKIVGIDTSVGVTYDIFKYGNLIQGKIDEMYSYFTQKYSLEFSEFLKFLWEDNITKLNIYTYETFGDSNSIENFRPSLSNYNEFEDANEFDIEYLKSVLFKPTVVNGSFVVKVLDDTGVYQNVQSIKDSFGQPITSEKEFYEYIDANKTINNLKTLIKTVDSKNSFDIPEVNFRDNILNTMTLTTKLSFESGSKFNMNLVYVFIFIIVCFILEAFIFKKVKKGDLI